MPPRNAAVPSSETIVAPEIIAEIHIPQSERDSVDNDFFIINRYLEGPIKSALFKNLPKGDITITIARK